MITDTELNTEQKVMNIQKEVEEATALELPMLEKNLVFLSTIASVATLLVFWNGNRNDHFILCTWCRRWWFSCC